MSNSDVRQAEFVTKLEKECIAMLDYAFANGLNVSPDIARALEEFKFEQRKTEEKSEEETPDKITNAAGKAEVLTTIHNELSEIVKPAKPQTILLIADETARKSLFFFVGKVPLIRQMMFVAIISLVSLIAISLSSDISGEQVVKSMFELNGSKLLMVQAILLASAALGASFTILYKANTYIASGTFDPKYESSYWVRLIVGLISGIILTQLIPLDIGELSEGMAKTTATSGDSVSSKAMLRVTLALLGGFSANLVYNILNRLVETVQALIIPDPVLDPIIIERQFLDKYNEKLLRYQNKITADASQIHKRLMEEGNQNHANINEIVGGFVQEVAKTQNA
ncbi:hypothetical protein [Desulfobacula phenolica]|uniref:Uncharacterized protein n=1 Tax=Desulfobacula phenolica TaxID=90732 RepID=A0A1H2JPT5_9BACT|nr:hypothetical protein [Desulfobacula phenolica]SDU58430.1 hypothetical protein SAMN04487931_11427 [Desulfobacula phenolica]